MTYDLMMMVFSVIMTLIFAVSIGGTILLYPLTRRLGRYLEMKLEEKEALGGRTPQDWNRMAVAMESIASRLKALEERQDFTEKLLSKPKEDEEGG